MAYASKNFKSKKAFKDAIQAGERITVNQPGIGTVPINGTVSVEGPWFPEPHKWYGTATMTNGIVTKVT